MYLDFTNYFGFRIEVTNIIILECIINHLPDFYIKNSYLCITFYDCNENNYIQISKYCIFLYNIKDPISVDSLYELIEWDDQALINQRNYLLVTIEVLI